MAPKTTRTVQHGEESRQRILDATIEIASERGYEGTSISLVSERSGLPVGSIYWHFGNKDGLLAAVIERSYRQWNQAQSGHAAAPGWGPGAQAALSETLAQTLIGSPEFLRLGLMLALERRPVEATARESFLRFRTESHERLVAVFAVALADRPGIDDALCRRLATLTVAMADGLFIAYQVQSDPMDARVLIDMFVQAVDALVQRAGEPQPS